MKIAYKSKIGRTQLSSQRNSILDMGLIQVNSSRQSAMENKTQLSQLQVCLFDSIEETRQSESKFKHKIKSIRRQEQAKQDDDETVIIDPKDDSFQRRMAKNKITNKSMEISAFSQRLNETIRNKIIDRTVDASVDLAKIPGNDECRQDVDQLEIQIREMQTILKRMTGQSEEECKIIPNKSYNIQLIKNAEVTFKVPCFGEPSPCFVRLNYPQHDQDLTLFISQTHIKPNQKLCEQTISSQKRFKIMPIDQKNEKEFTSSFIYLTLLSDTSKQIDLSVRFNNQKSKENQLVKQSKDEAILKNLQQVIPDNNILYPRSKKVMERSESPRTFIQYAKSWQERHEEALKKKENQDTYLQKKNEALQLKWDIVRERRVELLEKYHKVLNQKLRVEFWVHQMLKHLVINKFNGLIRVAILKKQQAIKTWFTIFKLQTKFKRRMKKIAPTFPERVRRLSRKFIVFFDNLHSSQKQEDASNCLRDFLSKNHLICRFNDNANKMVKMIEHIQKIYKKCRGVNQIRETFLSSEVWDWEKDKVSFHYVRQNKDLQNTKFATQAMIKVNQISEEVKLRVIKLFCVRQRLMHCVRFMTWITNKRKKHMTAKKLTSLKEGINIRLKQMYEIDQVLFMKLEIPKFHIPKSYKKDYKDYSIVSKPNEAFEQQITKQFGFNSLQRISMLLFPIWQPQSEDQENIKLCVPEINFEYTVLLGKNPPKLTYLPSSLEIFQRLVICAAFTVDEYHLMLSHSKY